MSAAFANMTREQLAQIPAAVPPPGVVPNFVDPPSDGYVLIAVGAALMAVMFLFAGIRFFVKLRIQHKVSADDWTTLVALIGTCSYYAICVYGVTRAKFATHMWDISVSHTMSDEFLIVSQPFP
ncbi:uncharacterized protein EI97DRAFT_93477 [Westerdykella ornata]|uniref:Uncharacterized protein n=1 Tax=Westerdykella ornata TaxID=318751 RepID=A0A6A6JF61_WESOR|nr:uncharacterized protein EI97DRAFT_93477 [Westerdykella ornata]KAF2274905.1 hypothetical protein EI97DRAFT_93477 [Westerdykella ornata]